MYTVCQFVIFSSTVVTIGFNTVANSVLKDASSVSIMNGTLAKDVVVTLSTEGFVQERLILQTMCLQTQMWKYYKTEVILRPNLLIANS